MARFIQINVRQQPKSTNDPLVNIQHARCNYLGGAVHVRVVFNVNKMEDVDVVVVSVENDGFFSFEC